MGWKMITSTVTAISLIIGGVFTIYDLEPRNFAPVLYGEYTELVEISKVLRIKHARDEWHQIKRDMDNMRRAKPPQPVPEYLKNRLFELEALIQSLGG